MRQQREAHGWTQKQLAGAAGCAEVTIQKAENGTHPPSTDLLLALLQAFAIPAEQHEAYLGWVVGLRPAPPDPPAAPPQRRPLRPRTPWPPSWRPDLAEQILARLVPVLQRQQAEAAAALELRIFSLLLYDRALARQEAAEWEAYCEQAREAKGALQRYTILLLGLGLLLGSTPSWGIAALVIMLGALGMAWGMAPWIALKRREGMPNRVSQVALAITSVVMVSAVATTVWLVQPLVPLFLRLGPLLLR